MNENLPVANEKKSSNPLIGIASAAEVLKAQKASEEAAVRSQECDPNPAFSNLEKYLSEIFEDARKYKEDETEIQKTMLDCLNRRNGQYDPEKLKKIKAVNSSEAFIPLTGVKCRAIEAFINDIYLNSRRKRTWGLRPTPIVTLSEEETKKIVAAVLALSQPAAPVEGQEPVAAPAMSPYDTYKAASDMRAEVIQRQYAEATDKAERMARKVDDQLTEGGFSAAFAEAVMDLSTFPCMIIKGPIYRKRKIKSKWSGGKIKYENKLIVTFERVSPLDFYPSRHSQHPNDGTPLCEKVLIQRSSLVANRKEDGYIEANIEQIAMAAPQPLRGLSGGLASDREFAEQRETLESGNMLTQKTIGSTLEGIEFSCSVRGADLISFGFTKDPDGKAIDPILDYEVNAITAANGKLVFLAYNKDPLGRRNYSVCGFAKEIGGFWYKSPPEILKDIQDIVNAAARAMVNNLAWASGPQVIIPDVNRLAPSEDITNIYVGKIWQGVVSGSASTNKLVEFFQPESRSAELQKIISEFVSLADKIIEMPAYTYGNDNISGAGRTSSGLSMLMSSSNRGIKRVVLDVDRKIFENVITQVVDYNLDGSEDEDIKGDMNFVSEGVMALMMKEQLSEQRMKFLQTTSNEWDMKVIGLDGRAKILAEALESLESDYDDIKPTEDKIRRLLEQEKVLEEQQIRENEIKIKEKEALIAREAQLVQMQVQIEMGKLEIAKREQDLEFKNKERELDIRASKISGDHLNKMRDQDMKAGLDADAADAKALGNKPAGGAPNA